MTETATSFSTIAALLAAGDLGEAVNAAGAAVKAKPTSAPARILLAELLTLQGALERADTHLKLAADHAPPEFVGISQMRWLLRAAEARKNWYENASLPEFLDQPTERQQATLQLALAIRDKDAATTQALRENLEAAPLPEAAIDGAAPVPIRDACDLSQHGFEVLTLDGRYLWIAPEQIENLRFQPIRRPRDRLWRPADTLLRDGRSAVFFVAAQYHDAAATDPQRLGLETDWVEELGGVARGRGQRMILADENIHGLLHVSRIDFKDAA
ncbi:MAG: type VI secretion system accessory protein TagJ [Pseudomonadota bacterium]